MNVTKTIYLKGFNHKKTNKKIIKIFENLIDKKNQTIKSLSKLYKDSYSKSLILKSKKHSAINLIGMGGSSLGAQAIYAFLKHRVKKKINFINNLDIENLNKANKKNSLNLIISKSGNTLETITNVNYLKINKKKVY